VSGKPSSGTNRDPLYDRALQLYLQGYHFKQIAKLIKKSRNQVSRWARENGWEGLRVQQQQQTPATEDHKQKYRKKVLAALDDPAVRPRNWREVDSGYRFINPDENVEPICPRHRKLFTCSSCDTEKFTDEELNQKLEEAGYIIEQQDGRLVVREKPVPQPPPELGMELDSSDNEEPDSNMKLDSNSNQEPATIANDGLFKGSWWNKN
jgi:hypothetical protein